MFKHLTVMPHVINSINIALNKKRIVLVFPGNGIFHSQKFARLHLV